MTKRKHIVLFLALLSIFLFQAISSYAVSWNNNLESSLKNAKSAKKPVMADFYTDWCGWCDKLDKDTYSDSKVASLARNFICVKVDGDKNRDAVQKYNIRGYPTVLFFDTGGNLIDQVAGYRGPADFAKIMEGVMEKTKAIPAAKSVYGKKEILSLPDGLKPSSKPSMEENNEGKTPLKLNGIVYQPKKFMAIINNVVVKEGDIIGEAKVVKITKNTVRLLYNNRNITLTIE